MLIEFGIILEHSSIVLIWKTWILSERVHESECCDCTVYNIGKHQYGLAVLHVILVAAHMAALAPPCRQR